MRMRYSSSREDIIIVFEGGSEMKLEGIKEVWTDESEQFIHFKDYFNDEVATVNYSKMLYFKPI